jgi:hypothetical protein
MLARLADVRGIDAISFGQLGKRHRHASASSRANMREDAGMRPATISAATPE